MISSEQKTKNKLELIIFDFDGVISKGRFYISGKHLTNPQIEIIRNYLFTGDNQDIMQAWMKGKISYQGVHRVLSDKTGIDVEFINESLAQSVCEMVLSKNILNFSNEKRKHGVKTVIMTDNMDIFDQLTVPFHQLNKYFDQIYSSSQHGLLKNEQEGEIFKQVLKEFQIAPSSVAFTDDSHSTGEIAKKIGINFFLFEEYDQSLPNFQEWLQQTFNN